MMLRPLLPIDGEGGDTRRKRGHPKTSRLRSPLPTGLILPHDRLLAPKPDASAAPPGARGAKNACLAPSVRERACDAQAAQPASHRRRQELANGRRCGSSPFQSLCTDAPAAGMGCAAHGAARMDPWRVLPCGSVSLQSQGRECARSRLRPAGAGSFQRRIRESLSRARPGPRPTHRSAPPCPAHERGGRGFSPGCRVPLTCAVPASAGAPARARGSVGAGAAHRGRAWSRSR